MDEGRELQILEQVKSILHDLINKQDRKHLGYRWLSSKILKKLDITWKEYKILKDKNNSLIDNMIEFVTPDEDSDDEQENDIIHVKCSAIIKSGVNKGKECGLFNCKKHKIENNNNVK